MKYSKVIIKQIPDSNPTAINLEKYNRSRFPNCSDVYCPALLPDGRYVTGLDPEGLDILTITDETERDAKIAEAELLVADLSKKLRKDLSPTSTFWDNFQVKINTNSDLVLSRINPLDVIKYHVLIANGYVAPSKEQAGDTRYLAASYYCHNDEVEASKNVSNRKLIDKAKAEITKIADNKEMLYIIGSYLEGTRYKKTMSPNTLYIMLSDYIEDKKNPENIQNFLNAAKLSVEDLQYKVTVETAIRKKIIKYKDGQYYRGGVNLGKNALEVYNNLKTPDYANEFIQIHEEVNSK